MASRAEHQLVPTCLFSFPLLSARAWNEPSCSSSSCSPSCCLAWTGLCCGVLLPGSVLVTSPRRGPPWLLTVSSLSLCYNLQLLGLFICLFVRLSPLEWLSTQTVIHSGNISWATGCLEQHGLLGFIREQNTQRSPPLRSWQERGERAINKWTLSMSDGDICKLWHSKAWGGVQFEQILSCFGSRAQHSPVVQVWETEREGGRRNSRHPTQESFQVSTTLIIMATSYRICWKGKNWEAPP